MAESRERLAILISGSGTTMAEMIKAIQSDPHIQRRIELAVVISSRADAGGIEKAKALDVPARDIVFVDPRDYRGPDGKKSPDLFGERLAEEFESRRVSVFTQNGWLPPTPPVVVDGWRGFNQHPGDPRDFGQIYGKQVHAAALHFSDQVSRAVPTFATAHEVTREIDGGEIVLYESFMIPKPTEGDRQLDGEAAKQRFVERVGQLQQSVLPREHAVQIRLLHRIADGNTSPVSMPRIVFSGEEALVTQAKQMAVERFPDG